MVENMLTKNFSESEMACKCGACGGKVAMDPQFMAKLQALREKWGTPMTITSAYRCSDHPVERDKVKPGAHSAGLAADIAVHSALDRYTMVGMAISMGFKGIGIAKGFVHLDIGHPSAPRPAFWIY